MNIYPSVLTADSDILLDQLRALREVTEVIQVDVIDGEFADNLTVSIEEYALTLSKEELPFEVDVHAMVGDPMALLERSSVVQQKRTFIAQIESIADMNIYITQCKEKGWNVGVSIDAQTDVSCLQNVLISDLAVVQIMGIRAGQQHQIFIPETLTKIHAVRALREESQATFEIIVDGGIKPENIGDVRSAGADSVVIGSYLWATDSPAHSIALLRAETQLS